MTSKICKLIMVTDPRSEQATAKSGNNKYYNMIDNGDGTFTAYYGRVGGHESTYKYSINKWDSKIRTQKRKGYIDVTPVKMTRNITFTGVHPEVLNLLNMLQGNASRYLSRTYVGNIADITPQQVQEALNYLTIASDVYQKDPDKANENLILVYSLFPRIMGNVGDYLIQGNDRDKDLIDREMDNLQTLTQQVSLQAGDKSEINPLEEMQLEIEPISKLPINDYPRHSAAFKVVNRATQSRYDKTDLDNEYELLWHGTKRGSTLPILQTGLDVKFAANGLFGRGIYHADDWHKASQYSGGFYYLQSVKMGKIYKPNGTMSSLNRSKIVEKGFDSCLGVASRNHKEYVVYANEQTTAQYLLVV